MLDRFDIIVLAVLVTVVSFPVLSNSFQDIAVKVMSFLLPNGPFVDYSQGGSFAGQRGQPDDAPERPRESYEEFSARRRREAWQSSSFAKDYASYEDYARKHGGYKAKAKTRSYAKAKVQSVPHTPRLGAMRVLGLKGNPTAAQIKSAYRKLARKHHPDNFMTKGPEAVEAAEAKMKNINAAYAYLESNPA